MVLVPLKAQFVSLIFSFAFLIAEIALLNAAINLNKYFECNALRKGHRVKIRHHQRRISLFTTAALLGFLALEISASFLSDPDKRVIFVNQRCISVDAISRRAGRNGRVFQEDVIGFKCIELSDILVRFRAGNFSFEEERVRCSSDLVMEIEANALFEYPLENAQRASPENPNPDPLLKCCQGACVVVRTVQTDKNSSLISVSNRLKAEELNIVRETRAESPMLRAKVYYDTSGLLSEFGDRALDTYQRNVRDPLELYRRIFLGSEETMCPFDKDLGDATEIPLLLIYVVSIVWSISVVLCFTSLLIQRSTFYDISNPVHWAKRTSHCVDELITVDPVVSSAYEEGGYVVYVMDSLFPKRSFSRLQRSPEP